jgi:hypothetical protein
MVLTWTTLLWLTFALTLGTGASTLSDPGPVTTLGGGTCDPDGAPLSCLPLPAP